MSWTYDKLPLEFPLAHLDYIVSAAETYGAISSDGARSLWRFMYNIDRDSDPGVQGHAYQRTAHILLPHVVHVACETWIYVHGDHSRWQQSGTYRQSFTTAMRMARYRMQKSFGAVDEEWIERIPLIVTEYMDFEPLVGLTND